MRLRETINRKPGAAIAVSVLLIAAVLSFLALRARGEREAGASAGGPKAWSTIDDGRTWFADAANKVVPLEHNGKTAYQCYVWTCDGGQTKFVSHLQRLKPEARKMFAGKDQVNPLDLVP